MTDKLPLGIWIADASSGEEVYANERFGQIMGTDLLGVAAGGYAAPYGIHDRAGRLLPNERMPFVRALEANGPVEQDDIVIHRRDGQKVFIRATAKPLFDADGKPELVVVAFTDITREVEAQKARDESDARAERAARMEAIGRLAAGTAHDFNNLLSVIRTTTFLVRDEPDPERRAADLDSIAEATDLAAALTGALLGFAGRGEGGRAAASLNQLVQNLATIFERSLDPRHKLTTRLESLRTIDADPVQVEQVIMNLIFNGCEAMPDGGRLGVITRDDGENSIVEVEDTGCGIPEDIRGRIFEPYVSSKSGVGHGRGLGLATAYGIVQSHGGSIDVARSDASGTLMRVVLPSVPTAGHPTGKGRSVERLQRVRGKILLVDDVDAVRLVTERALKIVGFDVVPATDGLMGVALFTECHATLAAVLLDVRMPGIDGCETLARMRAINPTVPIVFLTGYAGEELQNEMGAADGFLRKPADMQRLQSELDRVIAGRGR
ncbi:MAG: ATP-binding protein [Deltaproteobacteria bacterium]|nr:ATP-binding protein [Deltaproteobacteria bacterium]